MQIIPKRMHRRPYFILEDLGHDGPLLMSTIHCLLSCVGCDAEDGSVANGCQASGWGEDRQVQYDEVISIALELALNPAAGFNGALLLLNMEMLYLARHIYPCRDCVIGDQDLTGTAYQPSGVQCFFINGMKVPDRLPAVLPMDIPCELGSDRSKVFAYMQRFEGNGTMESGSTSWIIAERGFGNRRACMQLRNSDAADCSLTISGLIFQRQSLVLDYRRNRSADPDLLSFINRTNQAHIC